MNKKKGFTLVELLVVLVVIGIIIALLLPNLQKAIERGNVVQHDSDMRTINQALALCYSENRDNANWRNICGNIQSLITNEYLPNNFPQTGPFGEQYSIGTTDSVNSGGFDLIATCSGNVPTSVEYPCGQNQ